MVIFHHKQNFYLNFLEWTVDHCDKHVQQDNDHRNIIDSIKNIANIFNKLVFIIDDNWFNFWESKYSPEQCLETFFNTERRNWTHAYITEEKLYILIV